MYLNKKYGKIAYNQYKLIKFITADLFYLQKN